MDDISVLTDTLMAKFPKVMAQLLISHANLKYKDNRVVNNGECLNCNLLGIFSETSCSYRHTKVNRTGERIKNLKIKLESTIAYCVVEGGISKKIKHSVKS